MDPRKFVPASKKRVLLAVYLDLVLFSAAMGLLWHSFAPGQQNTAVTYGAFFLLEAVLLWLVKWSPGEYLLSIRQIRRAADPILPEGESTGPFLVDGDVRARESFWTIAVGVYLVAEAGKELVRWTMWTPPMPWFGAIPTRDWTPAVAIAQGLLSLVLAVLVLRLHFAAPVAISATSLFYAASSVWSWHLWPQFAKEAVIRRRAYQGLPVREGEVEMALFATTYGALAILLVLTAIILAHRGRFQRAGSDRE